MEANQLCLLNGIMFFSILPRRATLGNLTSGNTRRTLKVASFNLFVELLIWS
jgi:hypothetical protein